MGFMLQIKLEREDKRMKLTLPYNPTYIKKIKPWLFSCQDKERQTYNNTNC